VRQRLVLVPDERRQRAEELVGADEDLVVVAAVARGHLAGIVQLVGLALGERHTERLHLPVDHLGHGRRDRRRVDAAGQERAERHVGHEPDAHGLAEPLVVLVHQHRLGAAVGAGVGERQIPVLPQLHAAVAPHERVPRRQPPHAVEQRLVARRRVVGQEVGERAPVECRLTAPASSSALISLAK
jgi:hypothetical protein